MQVHLIRTLALAAVGLLLCGCNMVISPTPIFTEADAAGAPGLRPGLWIKVDEACTFDEQAKAADWPKCADPMIIEPTRMVDPAKPSETIAYVLAAGEPRVMQVQLVSPDKGKDALGAAITAQMQGYLFIGIGPLKTDTEGQITAAATWIALCGPPPPDPKEPKGAMDYATKRPFRGLTINRETGNCAPRDADAVRRAVAGSRGLMQPKREDGSGGDDASQAQSIRWVRDGRS